MTSSEAAMRDNPRNILLVAFDGLQPAQVTPALTPNLAAFVAEGVAFDNHHPSFPSVTRSNAATMTTGCYPGRHGLAANMLVMRDFDPHTAFSALEPTLAEVARKTPVLLAPTLADIMSRHGLEYVAVGTGTSGNAYVHNPYAATAGGATIHPEFCLPYPLHDDIIARFGEWPPEGETNADKLAHAVDITTEYVLTERQPAVTFVWFTEPDKAQHAHGVGAKMSNRALRETDEQFGRLLEWLDAAGADTDVLVISDHGYSTIIDIVEIEALLRDAGFPAGDEPGGVTVAGNGGAALFYAHDRDAATVDRLASWMMRQAWCGALVASDSLGQIEGTLPASLVGAEGLRAPDLAVSFRWDDRLNVSGYEGYVYSTGGAAGLGQHGSMGRSEMRCSLFARGGSFKRGVRIDSPTGNTDLAPTVLHLLGVSGADTMHGRVLTESLADGKPVKWQTTTHRAKRDTGAGVYNQHITISHVGDTIYLDEGNGGLAG
ncbi:MAG: alkaline phosphatase family protein [Chloroflexota bacterium]|nr:alkaline phosphatase family protein [Chloroflexota bacterium]